MTTAEIKARNMISTRTTEQLMADWELTEIAPMSAELPIVRGWIMDELESRDPEAYDAWMDDEDLNASPRTYFM